MTKLTLADLTCIIDSREQQPWDLSPMRTEAGTLSVGDYSVKGLESVIAIERKSLQDFVMCCGRERDRFQRELDRLRGWPIHAVIIEATWHELELGQWRSRLTSGQVQASFAAWIAQGHCLIWGGSSETAGKITRGVLFYAARYRLREAEAILKQLEGAA